MSNELTVIEIEGVKFYAKSEVDAHVTAKDAQIERLTAELDEAKRMEEMALDRADEEKALAEEIHRQLNAAESTVASLRRELEDKDAVIGKLPKTADGVPVIPGIDRVFHPDHLDVLGSPSALVECAQWASCISDVFNSESDENWTEPVSSCYSTESAALASTKGWK